MTATASRTVAVGDELPTLVVTPTRTQLFLFSAATNNAHRIHYDRSWAVDVEGLPDVVVHGPFQGALLQRLVTEWLGASGRLTGFRVRHQRSAFPGDELTFAGTVSAVDHGDQGVTASIDLRETNAAGDVLSIATATVLIGDAS